MSGMQAVAAGEELGLPFPVREDPQRLVQVPGTDVVELARIIALASSSPRRAGTGWPVRPGRATGLWRRRRTGPGSGCDGASGDGRCGSRCGRVSCRGRCSRQRRLAAADGAVDRADASARRSIRPRDRRGAPCPASRGIRSSGGYQRRPGLEQRLEPRHDVDDAAGNRPRSASPGTSADVTVSFGRPSPRRPRPARSSGPGPRIDARGSQRGWNHHDAAAGVDLDDRPVGGDRAIGIGVDERRAGVQSDATRVSK